MSAAKPPRKGFRHGAQPPRGADAERLLSVSTELVLGARARNAALAALDLERQIATGEHEWAPYRGLAVHLERHGSDPEAPTVVVAHGLGDHARRQLPLAAALGELEFNSLLRSRPAPSAVVSSSRSGKRSVTVSNPTFTDGSSS